MAENPPKPSPAARMKALENGLLGAYKAAFNRREHAKHDGDRQRMILADREAEAYALVLGFSHTPATFPEGHSLQPKDGKMMVVVGRRDLAFQPSALPDAWKPAALQGAAAGYLADLLDVDDGENAPDGLDWVVLRDTLRAAEAA